MSSFRKFQYGVDYPAIGEYDCTDCNRHWMSSKTWKDYGQECTKCHEIRLATQMYEPFYYYCTECDKSWKSKWSEEGEECKDCGQNVEPLNHAAHKMLRKFIMANKLHDPSAAVGELIDPTKAHRMDLCEKCIKTGRSCILPLAPGGGSSPDKSTTFTVSVPKSIAEPSPKRNHVDADGWTVVGGGIGFVDVSKSKSKKTKNQGSTASSYSSTISSSNTSPILTLDTSIKLTPNQDKKLNNTFVPAPAPADKIVKPKPSSKNKKNKTNKSQDVRRQRKRRNSYNNVEPPLSTTVTMTDVFVIGIGASFLVCLYLYVSIKALMTSD